MIQREKKLRMEISEETKENEGRGQKGGCVEGKKKKKKGSPLMFRRRHIRCCRSESETLEID